MSVSIIESIRAENIRYKALASVTEKNRGVSEKTNFDLGR